MKIYALQYSTQQKCFDIDLLNDVIKSNINQMGNKNQSDYKIIWFGSEDDCYNRVEAMIRKNPNLLHSIFRKLNY